MSTSQQHNVIFIRYTCIYIFREWLVFSQIKKMTLKQNKNGSIEDILITSRQVHLYVCTTSFTAMGHTRAVHNYNT